MTETRIIFLDIDGTLNKLHVGAADFDPGCVQALNRIIEASDALIVLSSSWRYRVLQGSITICDIGNVLISNGVKGAVVDITRADEGDEPRWKQIADWLKKPRVKVSRYCILDDDSDAFGGRPGVQTSGATGLTEKDADLAIEILCGRKPQPEGR